MPRRSPSNTGYLTLQQIQPNIPAHTLLQTHSSIKVVTHLKIHSRRKLLTPLNMHRRITQQVLTRRTMVGCMWRTQKPSTCLRLEDKTQGVKGLPWGSPATVLCPRTIPICCLCPTPGCWSRRASYPCPPASLCPTVQSNSWTDPQWSTSALSPSPLTWPLSWWGRWGATPSWAMTSRAWRWRWCSLTSPTRCHKLPDWWRKSSVHSKRYGLSNHGT